MVRIALTMCSDGAVGGDAGDEGAVDLDLVEHEIAQAPEAGLAGAEIVERDANTCLAQVGDDAVAVSAEVMTAVSVISSSSRCGSKPDAAEVDSTLVSGAGVHQLRRRKIERQEQFARPGECGLGCLAQQRFRQRVDEAALFGKRHEDAGRDEAEIRIVPAGERLEAEHLPRWPARRSAGNARRRHRR
jgi:hypothetical protein